MGRSNSCQRSIMFIKETPYLDVKMRSKRDDSLRKLFITGP